MTTLAPFVLPPRTAAALRRWVARWGQPDLAATLHVGLSPRLRATLGRAYPAETRIALHPALADAPAALLDLVLCHEAAHVAAWRAARDAGRRVRPHGPEWAALVRAAGHEPVTRVDVHDLHPLPSRRPTRAAATFDVAHTCPVCHARRLARRAVPRWRCAACVAAGLEGRMIVTRLHAPA